MSDLAARSLGSGVVLASAGSGKTYALSSRIVRLLLMGVGPERILASTFTRAAAGQILERVARRLADAAGDAGARRELASHLGLASLDASEARAALRRLTGALGSLSICTLDAFFSRLASAHALELDLPPAWRIAGADEDDRQRDLALEGALREGSRGSWITLLRLLRSKRYVSGVARSLRRVVDEALAVYATAPASAWSALELPADAAALDPGALGQALAVLEGVALPRNKQGEVNRTWKNAHAKSLGQAATDDWEGFVGRGLASKLAGGEETFQKLAIDEAVRAAYAPLLAHARHVLLSRLGEGTRATHELLDRFDAAYASLKRSGGLYTFDDIPRALRRGATLTLEEIAYRLDARYDHVLLDEFQDTSVTQFLLLEPLVEEILSGGAGAERGERSVLVVGDVKQSLFGWREAEPELLASLRDRWPQLNTDTLARNYRSSPVVLDAVNRVFGELRGNAALGEHADVAAQWQARFERHTAARALAGHVRLVEVRPEGTEEGAREDREPERARSGEVRAALVEAGARAAARFVRERAGASVGVLVRTRKPIPRLIMALRALGVSASEEGGNPLTDSPAVAVVVSAMRLAQHPGDSAAAFHVASSPLGTVLEFRDWDDAVARRRAASGIRAGLAREGCCPLVDRWRREMAGSSAAADARRLDQLVELAREFDERAGTSPADFVALVEGRKVDDPSGAGVRVMTIHRSKGQEFDAVVLMDLDGKVPGQAPALLTRRPSPFDAPDLVTRNASAEVRSLDPRLEALARAQARRELSEALCVLYVGMTRARHALEILVGPASKTLSLAGIARAGLGERDQGVLFERGSEGWVPAGAKGAGALAPAPTIALAPRQGGAGLRAPSRRASFDAGLAFASGARAAREVGTLLHAALEGVEWLEEGSAPGPIEAPEGLGAEGVRRLREAERHLGGATIRAALSRRAYDPWAREGLTLEVRREVPFALCAGDRPETGPLTLGRIDRLVLGRRGAGGPVARAEVIDFKTDEPRGRSPEQLADEHRAQMEEYRAATARMTGLAPAAVSCVVLFLRVPALVRL